MTPKTINADQAYKALCTEFYDLIRPLASGEEINFYKNILTNKNVLEVMCGSGRLLIPLLKAGLQVDGLDNSSEMLDKCRKKLKNENLNSILYEQAIETINFSQKYDALLIAMGSIQLLHPRDHAFEILSRLKKALTPNGQIFVETFVPWEVLYKDNDHREKEQEVESAPHTKIHLRSINQVDKFHQLIISKNFYDKIYYGKSVQTEQETLHINWYYPYEMIYFLERAGFKNIELHKVSFSQNPNGILYIAQKALPK